MESLRDKDGNIIGWHIEPDPETREATQKWLVENTAPKNDWHVWQWKNWLIDRLFTDPIPLGRIVSVELSPPLLGTEDPNYRPKGQMLDFSGVMGIPPKVEYGREKDTIIRDERQGDPGGNS